MNAPNPNRQTRSLELTMGQSDKARELRHTPTVAERAAWYLLRGLRLKGFDFRRQHPVRPYIADLCFLERRLIVELDGGVHGQPSQERSDVRRHVQLKSPGYNLLGGPNGLVLQAPELPVQEVLNSVWSLPEA